MFLQNSICNIYNITYVIYQYYIFVSICNIYVITYKLHINYILYNCISVGNVFCHNSHPSVDQLHPQRNPTADDVCTLLVPVHPGPQFITNYHLIQRCRVHMGSHHNLDPEHVPAVRHPVTIDQSGDPTLKFQTGSMIRPERMSYRRSEPVRDNRSRL